MSIFFNRPNATRAFCLGALVSVLTWLAPAKAQYVQQGPKLVGTNGTSFARQGWSVALSADGNTMAVGGITDGSPNPDGAVWVFTRSGSTWTQQGSKLVGTGGTGAQQGYSVALSADGNTALVGGRSGGSAGAAWVFVRSGGVWTQQGGLLSPNDATGFARMGASAALSADGNTALLGGDNDNGAIGAAWVFVRSGGVWTQQGGKLVGGGAVSQSGQGGSVALSADGNTALVGGSGDNPDPNNFNRGRGAAWVFTRSGSTWAQQGGKLTGGGGVGTPLFGTSVALSADGNTALIGGPFDNSFAGAVWTFTRSGGTWTQQGSKFSAKDEIGNIQLGRAVALSGDGNTALVGAADDGGRVFLRSGGVWNQLGKKFVGSGEVGSSSQGSQALALSGDGRTAVLGGLGDDSQKGATWAFVLNATPVADIVANGNAGGPFTPASFDYTLYATSAGSVDFTITGVPDWLTASPSAGTIPSGGTQVVTFSVNGTAAAKAGGTYGPTPITLNGLGASTVNATLNVVPPQNVTLASAVLPSSRSVQVGHAATAFMTVINTSTAAGVNCGLGLGSNIAAGFKFQTTDPATNAATGTPNTPAAIPGGQAQSYVFAITPGAAFPPTDVVITAGCSNSSAPAPSVVGLNTLLLSASTDPVPDIVALAATPSNDGIVNIPGPNGAGAFAVATVNVGASGAITVSADTGAATLPVTLTVCATNPSTGQCLAPPSPSVTTTINANATPTFAVFVQGAGTVPFDPANNRVFVRFKDSGAVTRGATSVAVRTQ